MFEKIARVSILALIINWIPCYADVPAVEMYVIKTSNLISLLDQYRRIPDIPNEIISKNSDFYFFSERGNFNSIQIRTPHETMNVHFVSEFALPPNQPTESYTITSTPKITSEGRLDIKGKIAYVDPSLDPVPELEPNPQQESGKKKKKRMLSMTPYFITENWRGTEYTVLLYRLNLKH